MIFINITNNYDKYFMKNKVKKEGVKFEKNITDNNISLWRMKESKEERITTNIKLDEYSWFYGHYNLENSLAVYVH